MFPHNAIVDFMRSGHGSLPTPDALMVALLEQQKLLERKDDALDKQSAEIINQQAWIKVLEERLRLKDQRLFGASSEKNLSQEDWIADEAEVLADGEPDTDDGEVAADEDTEKDPEKKPRKPRARSGFSPDLPRTQRYICLSDEEREGAVDTFFVKVKEELDIIPAQVQVIEIMQEKAVYLDDDGERCLKSAERPAHPIGKSIASINLLAWVVIAKYADAMPLYRLEKILARYGGQITRTTLANWIIRLSVTLQPLLDRLDKQLMLADYLQIDETRLQVLKEPGMSPTGDKWIWVMRGGRRAGRWCYSITTNPGVARWPKGCSRTSRAPMSRLMVILAMTSRARQNAWCTWAAWTMAGARWSRLSKPSRHNPGISLPKASPLWPWCCWHTLMHCIASNASGKSSMTINAMSSDRRLQCLNWPNSSSGWTRSNPRWRPIHSLARQSIT